ncbi:MAG: hypothetical protein JRF63_10560, partial [Deltaproteobacteria bacterium]|nr:hypothetical protein [Deltaproteobacteria bacterium]
RPAEGSSALIELHRPEAQRGEAPRLGLGVVSHGYRAWGGFGDAEKALLVGESGSCNIDVTCLEGLGWEDPTRSVMRILSGGTALCTGALINNTANDCTPYVLTANHCNLLPPSLIFQFNYQYDSCGGGSVETSHVLSGSTQVASYADSDMLLLEMDEIPPAEFDVYYAGWNRSPVPASRSTGIHHPSGDVKKISHNHDPLINGPGAGSGWGPDHWRVTEWEEGTTEPTSSGSPLFDTNQLIVGQLHGGLASCESLDFDEYGKFNVSWTGGGTSGSSLESWLDSESSGVETLPGIDHTFCTSPQVQLLYVDHQIDDGAGNGNGHLDPGENIEMLVRVTNTGTLPATEVIGTLSSSTPLVTVTSGQATWPDLAADQAALSNAPFGFSIDPAFECGAPINFRLQLAAAEQPGTWSTEFNLVTGELAGSVVPFEDDMEGGETGWTPSTIEGSNPWYQTSDRSNSPATSWFVQNVEGINDSVLLLAPLSDLPSEAELRFMHYMRSEPGFDGGVLEYRADDGVWQSVVVDLSSLAGSTVSLRWRFATDAIISSEGWYLDDVVVSAPLYECAPPILTPPGEVSDCLEGQDPFRFDKVPGGYELSWSAPVSGASVDEYVLYSRPITSAKRVAMSCVGTLGTQTSTILPELFENRSFVVVARNDAGESTYGTNSDGIERNPSPQVCP